MTSRTYNKTGAHTNSQRLCSILETYTGSSHMESQP